MSSSPDEIAKVAKKLEDASAAYYETGKPIMTDEEFDELKEYLEEIAPDHPFLKKVGAPVKSGTVQLPFPMPSLNKIKTPEAIASFVAATTCNKKPEWVLSEKLDGISALWIPGKRNLYLRGDGAVGQDVSEVARMGIHGLPVRLNSYAVRGEILITKADTPAETIGRSWVNGVLHKSSPALADVQKLRFVAYEIMDPSSTLTREEQLVELKKRGYEIPWSKVVGKLDRESLEAVLREQRTTSKYDTDGIVVGMNCVPQWYANPKKVVNPKDQVAFKMVLADQLAETRVVAVHWGLSHQGYLIPRLEVTPVRVGGAVITYVTAHNAKVIAEKKICVGAKIRIRRSGDVIPTIDAVLLPCGEGDMPPEGTYEWATDVHIRAKDGGDDLLESKLRHFASSLEIEGLGPGNVKKLMAVGIKTPRALCSAALEGISVAVGLKNGMKIYSEIRRAAAAATEMDLMVASSQMPRGVGHTKLTALFALEKDPRKWAAIKNADGWTAASLAAFLVTLPDYEKWRRELPLAAYPILPTVTASAAAAAIAPVEDRGAVCFTGFRDAALERKLETLGFTIAAGVTKKVIAVIIADGAEASGTKVEKAKTLNIPILEKTKFLQQFKIPV